jgi:DNA-binding SARP family transcriptional activator/TolB-like protein
MDTRTGAQLTLRLLGGFQITTADGRDVTPPGKKLRALVACLALPPDRGWSRERLTELLWGDRDEEQARASLRQALAELRRLLGDASLLADRETVAFDPAAVSVDALEFTQRAARGEIERAADLYRGDLLDGVTLPDSSFGDWLLVERTRLHDLAVQVLARLVDSQCGEAAIRTAQRLLHLDPLRESTHRALMQLYAASGQRSQALRQFQLCRDSLQQELGVKPEPETDRLCKEIQKAANGCGPSTAQRKAVADAPIEIDVLVPSSLTAATADANVMPPPRAARNRRGIAAAAMAAFILAVGAVWYAWQSNTPGSPSTAQSAGTKSDAAQTETAAAEALPPVPIETIKGIPVIVVLPFKDNTGDQTSTDWGTGIADKFATDLRTFPDYLVVSSTSSPVYAQMSVPEIKKVTNATFIIEGDYTRGDQVAFEIRLVRASTDWILWHSKVVLGKSDPVTLQDAAAVKLRDTLGGMTGALRKEYEKIAKEKVVGDLEGRFDGNLTEYDYYVLGHIYHLQWPRTPKNRQLTRAIWEQGLSHYPDSPLLASKLAFAYGLSAFKAKELLDSVAKWKDRTRLDEWYYHWAKAFWCDARHDRDCAIAEARAAIALAPFDAISRADLSEVAADVGYPDEAIAWATFAATHDPDPKYWYFDNLLRAHRYGRSEQWQELITLAKSQIESNKSPNKHWYRMLAEAYAHTNQNDKAKEFYRKFYDSPGN